MTENRMNGGASGGAFIGVFKGAYTAVGVNSHRTGAYMSSPLFDGATTNLYMYVLAGCPKPQLPG
jgi:hypothetical protein